jgi:hypothetical protein
MLPDRKGERNGVAHLAGIRHIVNVNAFVLGVVPAAVQRGLCAQPGIAANPQAETEAWHKIFAAIGGDEISSAGQV